MIEPAVVYERTCACDVAAEKFSQLTEHGDVFFGLDAAAACNEDFGLIDGLAFKNGGDNLKNFVIGVSVNSDVLHDNFALAGCISGQGIENMCTNGDHLGTQFGNADVSEQSAAECRSGLYKCAFVIKTEVDSISGKAGAEFAHHAGSNVSADGGSGEDEDRGLVLGSQLRENLLIGSCTVIGKICVFSCDDLVCTVCSKTSAMASAHTVACEDMTVILQM